MLTSEERIGRLEETNAQILRTLDSLDRRISSLENRVTTMFVAMIGTMTAGFITLFVAMIVLVN
jgi:chromosome segregation ATPase